MNSQARVGDPTYGTFDDEFLPLSPLALEFPNFALQILVFLLETHCFVIIDARVLQTFYTTWVWELLTKNQNQLG